MKILLTLLLILLPTICYSTDSTVGVPIRIQIPEHGHANSYDGGVLKPVGALVYDADLTIPNAFEVPVIRYVNASPTTPLYDTGSLHSIVGSGNTQRSRFTVPAGYNYANASIHFLIPIQDQILPEDNCIFYMNDDVVVGKFQPLPANTVGGGASLYTGMVSVVPGDYFEVACSHRHNIIDLSMMRIFFGITIYR